MLAWVDHDHSTARRVAGRLSAVDSRGTTTKMFCTGQRPAGERDIEKRRVRITDAWRWFLQEASGEFLLAAEDDTLPDEPDAYMRLLDHLAEGAVLPR